MRKLDILYKNQENDMNMSYLYDKTEKVILPIETIAGAERDIYFIIKSLLFSLKACLNHMEIYFYNDSKFYSYLIFIDKKGTKFKINCDIENSLNFALAFNTPVYIKESILKEQGIKITPEFIRAQLTG